LSDLPFFWSAAAEEADVLSGLPATPLWYLQYRGEVPVRCCVYQSGVAGRPDINIGLPLPPHSKKTANYSTAAELLSPVTLSPCHVSLASLGKRMVKTWVRL